MSTFFLQTAFEDIALAPSAEFRQHCFRHCRAFAAQTIKNQAGRGVVGQFASMLLRRQGQCAADMPAPIFCLAANVHCQRTLTNFRCRFLRSNPWKLSFFTHVLLSLFFVDVTGIDAQ